MMHEGCRAFRRRCLRNIDVCSSKLLGRWLCAKLNGWNTTRVYSDVVLNVELGVRGDTRLFACYV